MSKSKSISEIPQHRVFEPGKRHMELIASVSRSSGLEKGGDALRDFKVQEEYRLFVQSKLDGYWKRYPPRSAVDDLKHKEETEANLLILFRKLREGILSTQRKDSFATEVYETSLYLSILFRSPSQTTSILSYLLPNLYLASKPSKSGAATFVPLSPNALSTSLLSLLNHLICAYPSQSTFYAQLQDLPPVLLPCSSAHKSDTFSVNSRSYADPQLAVAAHVWIRELARCLRGRNYAQLDILSCREAFVQFVPSTSSDLKHSGATANHSKHSGSPSTSSQALNLPLEALCILVDSLRAKARATAWQVLRRAYREFICTPPSHVTASSASVTLGTPSSRSEEKKDHACPAAPSSTTTWLARSLALAPLSPSVSSRADVQDESAALLVDRWLTERCAAGEVRQKEGMAGRWVVCKA
ncbi:hypothetical protein A0H81_11207 [Grifola frondosa]|uniref:Uncharacterized protein n=1 Tax=Grifola frondosa TaxID=5627 RepID=A0A1C7LVQ7_GRIFR|nr:hypothetical protein A0H81_11207 [Grifola frondosa]